MSAVWIVWTILTQAAVLSLERGPCGARNGTHVVACSSFAGRTIPPLHGRQAPSSDRWFGEDKVRHLSMSFAVTSYAYAGLRAVNAERRTALAGAGTVALVAGIGKELYDRRIGRGFSHRDLLWDLAGTSLAMLILDRTR